jgi:hypothetical protein
MPGQRLGQWSSGHRARRRRHRCVVGRSYHTPSPPVSAQRQRQRTDPNMQNTGTAVMKMTIKIKAHQNFAPAGRPLGRPPGAPPAKRARHRWRVKRAADVA